MALALFNTGKWDTFVLNISLANFNRIAMGNFLASRFLLLLLTDLNLQSPPRIMLSVRPNLPDTRFT